LTTASIGKRRRLEEARQASPRDDEAFLRDVARHLGIAEDGDG
jgi:hypothetical protein